MLRTLRIRNLVIIDDITVEFGEGLNLLTGETGAGKSILVDALGLAVGARADRSLVRSGADKATVEALFELPPGDAVLARARENGLAEEGEQQLLVRREVAAGGSNSIRVNGSPCTQSILRDLGLGMLEIHGQHEHQSLLGTERHLELLDLWGGHEKELAAVRAAYRRHRESLSALDKLREQVARRQERSDRLQRIVREIDAVEPSPGEMNELDRRRTVLRNSERMVELLRELLALTYEGDGAAASAVWSAVRRATQLAELDPELEPLAGRLESAAVELQDLGAAFFDYRESRDFDPSRLDELESRKAAIETLCLSYGEDEQAVLDARELARQELAQLGTAEDAIREAQQALDEAAQIYVKDALRLGQRRAAAAGEIVPRLEAQLGELALGQARVDVEFTPTRAPEVARAGGQALPLAPHGAERAELLLAANPGEPFRPLARVASGGELSRLMLALHAVFEDAGEGRALVFDEVDSGVGGKVADAVGAKLARLAEGQQVLCVTHLPQVAAYAARHFTVSKRVADGRTNVEIACLTQEERVEELARMMGGRKATAASRRHASEMLDISGRRAARPAEGM